MPIYQTDSECVDCNDLDMYTDCILMHAKQLFYYSLHTETTNNIIIQDY